LAVPDGANLGGELHPVETREVDPLCGAAAFELRQVRQQGVPPVELVGSEGGDQDDPRLMAVASKVGEQVEGRRVGPMDVLDHEHKPSVTRQPHEQTEKDLEQPRLPESRPRSLRSTGSVR